MWKFLVICFIALGWSFYELSGGADYAPVENSLQVQSRLERTASVDVNPEVTAAEERARLTVAEVEATMGQLGQVEEEADALTTTLASTRLDAASVIEVEANRPKAELLELTLPAPVDATQPGISADIDAAIAAAMGEVIIEAEQIRWVKETVVDLRSGPGLTFDKVTQITKGTEVAVLEDPGHGWINVRVMDSYQTGWLAEWLVMDPE